MAYPLRHSGVIPFATTYEQLSRQLHDFSLQLHTLNEAVSRKADASKVEALSSKVALLSSGLDEKAEFCEVKQCHDALQTLSAIVGSKVEGTRFEQWDHRLQVLENFVHAKQLELPKLEALERQVNDLETHKAEFKEVEHVHKEVMNMYASLTSHNYVSELDRLKLQMDELALYRAVPGVPLPSLESMHQHLCRLEDLIRKKADHATVVDFCNQLTESHNAMTSYVSQRVGSPPPRASTIVSPSTWQPHTNFQSLRGPLPPGRPRAWRSHSAHRNRLRTP